MRDGMSGRRRFLSVAAGSGALWALAAPMGLRAEEDEKDEKKEGKEPEVGPNEDLMREHGVLRRVLLVYEEALRRLDKEPKVALPALQTGAEVVRRFIEDYHEKQEEEFVFPRFEKAGKRVGLVEVLLAQHRAGRRLTASILQLSERRNTMGASDRKRLEAAVHDFIRMYRPHAAREDTVLFPEFHELLGEKSFDELGDAMEAREKETFKGEGFEQYVAKVEALENTLGIEDLARFTPRSA